MINPLYLELPIIYVYEEEKKNYRELEELFYERMA